MRSYYVTRRNRFLQSSYDSLYRIEADESRRMVSWFWVLSPMIFGAALTVLVLLTLFIIMLIANS